MGKPFNRETKNYRGNSTAETPYQRSKQAWDDRLGSATVQAKNWRLIAVINGLLAILLAIALIILIIRNPIHLFVAQVGHSGRVINVAPLKVNYQPSQAEKAYFLTDFIKLVRTVPLDPVVAKNNWLHAYDFLSQRGADQLNHYWQAHHPTELLGKETVTVTINSVNAMSPHSFNIDWTETTVDLVGHVIHKKAYSGVLTIALSPPKTEKKLLTNPLGLYITDINFSPREPE